MHQILAVTEAAITAPQLSGAVFRRNMLPFDSPTKQIALEHACAVQRSVYAVSKELTQRQYVGLAVNDFFGAFTVFAEQNAWSEMMHKHNKCKSTTMLTVLQVQKHNNAHGSYHLCLFEFCVLGSQLLAERDFMKINFSSLHMS